MYADDTATTHAPAVDAYNLTYEPVIWLADATGKITMRLDAAWDQTELNESLDALLKA